MKSKLQTDAIYDEMEKFYRTGQHQYPAEQIFESIEKGFQQLDPTNSQNFLNYLVEEFPFFSQINGVFERVQALAHTLINSETLSNKTIGITVMTKLWIAQPEGREGISDFVQSLFKSAQYNDQFPHYCTICSQCLLEIYYSKPNAIQIPITQIYEAANGAVIPTAFPELLYAMSGPTKEITDLFDKRFWSMSPFETIQFEPTCKPTYPSVPNDPLLLHGALESNTVSQDTALSLINSPFSSFGVSSVLLGFNEKYSFDGPTLFNTFDSKEQIAAKACLLPPKMESIEQNPVLADFVNLPASNPIVSAVFDIASRFEPADLFKFFRSYFESTPFLDPLWVSLYQTQQDVVQSSLRVFLSQYISREATAKVLLMNNIPELPVINSIKNQELCSLISGIAQTAGTPASQLASEKLKEFGKAPAPQASSSSHIDPSSSPITLVDQPVITTSEQITTISMPVEVNENVPTPLYAVSFIISNPEIFEKDDVYNVPTLSRGQQVSFHLKPKKVCSCKCAFSMMYSLSDGTIKYSRLDDLNVPAHALLSPTTNDFAQAWQSGEESRVIVPLSFQEFITLFNNTVFGMQCVREENRVQSVVITPSESSIPLTAFANGPTSTTVQFKAPTLQLLTIVDEFVRTTFK